LKKGRRRLGDHRGEELDFVSRLNRCLKLAATNLISLRQTTRGILVWAKFVVWIPKIWFPKAVTPANIEAMPAKRQEPTAHVHSPAIEDYLEQIHNLIEGKGYARVVDIAANLGISQASVTNMIQKLDAEGYLVYERYRGVVLTQEGRKIGQEIARRHEVLTRLLATFGLDAATVHQDVEGMEHHISRQTLAVLTLLMEELEGNPDLLKKLKRKLKNS